MRFSWRRGRAYGVTRAIAFLALSLPTLVWGQAVSSEELQLASLIQSHGSQTRPTMVWDERLHIAARAKARDLAKRGYVDHVDLDGYGMNYVAKLAGYGVPTWYTGGIGGNNVESLAGGQDTPTEALNAWLGSPGHKSHVFANPVDSGFFFDQTHFAVGHWYDPSSLYKHYWVFVSLPPDGGLTTSTGDVEWMFECMLPVMIDDSTGDADGDGTHHLLEYVLKMDPTKKDLQKLPAPVLDVASGVLSLTPALRPDLDPTVSVEMLTTTSLSGGWSTAGVTRVGDTFSVGVSGGRQRFLKLKVSKP